MHMSLLSKRWKWKVLSTNEVEHFEYVPFWLASSIFFGVPIYREASAKAISDLSSLEAAVAQSHPQSIITSRSLGGG